MQKQYNIIKYMFQDLNNLISTLFLCCDWHIDMVVKKKKKKHYTLEQNIVPYSSISEYGSYV